MPFLHCSKKIITRSQLIEENSSRNGWRCKIFRPTGGYYKGNWKRNKHCGKGVQFLPSGFQYEGDWINNNKHGFGVLSKYNSYDKIFNLVYIGDYQKNQKHVSCD